MSRALLRDREENGLCPICGKDLFQHGKGLAALQTPVAVQYIKRPGELSAIICASHPAPKERNHVTNQQKKSEGNLKGTREAGEQGILRYA